MKLYQWYCLTVLTVLRHWLQICRKGRHSSSLLNNTKFSENFNSYFSRRAQFPSIFSHRSFSDGTRATQTGGALVCICEGKFGVPQHVQLWTFSDNLWKLLPLRSHSAETSIWHFLPYETFVFEDNDRKEGKAKLSITKRSVQSEVGWEWTKKVGGSWSLNIIFQL